LILLVSSPCSSVLLTWFCSRSFFPGVASTEASREKQGPSTCGPLPTGRQQSSSAGPLKALPKTRGGGGPEPGRPHLRSGFRRESPVRHFQGLQNMRSIVPGLLLVCSAALASPSSAQTKAARRRLTLAETSMTWPRGAGPPSVTLKTRLRLRQRHALQEHGPGGHGGRVQRSERRSWTRATASSCVRGRTRRLQPARGLETRSGRRLDVRAIARGEVDRRGERCRRSRLASGLRARSARRASSPTTGPEASSRPGPRCTDLPRLSGGGGGGRQVVKLYAPEHQTVLFEPRPRADRRESAGGHAREIFSADRAATSARTHRRGAEAVGSFDGPRASPVDVPDEPSRAARSSCSTLRRELGAARAASSRLSPAPRPSSCTRKRGQVPRRWVDGC
jgi:hypothetical protein